MSAPTSAPSSPAPARPEDRSARGSVRRPGRPGRPAWLPTILLTGLAACSGGDAPEGPGDARPNVLLVTLDTVRADFLSSYGSDIGRTPTLDALAARGTRFANAQSASAVTPVSHASILTGLYPYHHGLRVLSAGSGYRLDGRHPTLAQVLHEEGYRTAAVHSAFPVSAWFGFERGFDHFDSFDNRMQADPDKGRTAWDTRTFQRRSDETTDRALGFVDDAGLDGQPFFLWLHYWDPHDPHLMPPPEWTAKLDLSKVAGTHSRPYRGLYAAELGFLDDQLGRLLEGLDQRGLLANTLIVVTADHGEGLSDGHELHGWSKHRMTYREQLHVPLIVAGPGVTTGEVDALVRTVDVFPTVLDYARVEGPEGLDGSSLRPLAEGEPEAPRSAYADQVNGFDLNAGMVQQRPDAAFLYTINDGEWKLIHRPHMPEASELFHLAVDPLEEHDVLQEHPEVALRLLEDLAARDPWVLEPFPAAGDHGDASEILSSLGYSSGGEGGPEPLDWWWTCPVHAEVREGAAGTCGEPDCGRHLVPRTVWK